MMSKTVCDGSGPAFSIRFRRLLSPPSWRSVGLGLACGIVFGTTIMSSTSFMSGSNGSFATVRSGLMRPAAIANACVTGSTLCLSAWLDSRGR